MTADRNRRWRLILGGPAEDSIPLDRADLELDRCLGDLYDEGDRTGVLRGSSPKIARWLGDVRRFFPDSVVSVLQQDAVDRLGLEQMLLQPELLSLVEADLNIVTTLMSLHSVMPAETIETARIVVRKVVAELTRELEEPLREAVSGTLNRSIRNPRPRLPEIDWDRTIRKNLAHYVPEYQTVIPESLVGFGRRRSSLRDIVLCVDQSGSMATSVVYASVFGAVLASLPAVRTRFVAFDTAVVDLSEKLQPDPVDVIFGVQLGGGTDINLALSHCQSIIERPSETILVLISDLYEGGDREEMLRRAAALVAADVNVITLLALSDDGQPGYDSATAQEMSRLGIPCFACTPDQFASLMAAAIRRDDLSAWAASRNLKTLSQPGASESDGEAMDSHLRTQRSGPTGAASRD